MRNSYWRGPIRWKGAWPGAGSAPRRSGGGSRGSTLQPEAGLVGRALEVRLPRGFRTLDRALEDFIASKKSERKGRCLGFPDPQEEGTMPGPLPLQQGMMCGAGTTVTLPRSGTIRSHETTDALASLWMRRRILSATVSRSAQRWFRSLAVEVKYTLPDRHPGPGESGRRRCGHHGLDHRRGSPWAGDPDSQATTMLASWYETAVEDLNVAGMVCNRRLARSLSTSPWGGATATRPQDRLAWRSAPRRRTVLSQLQDPLGGWDGERRAVPGRAPDTEDTVMKQEPGTAPGPHGTYPVGFPASAGKTGTAMRGPHEASLTGFPATGQLVAVGCELTVAH
jgi:hypothetical protein